ncbi:UNVERIFIED_CONTAM: hypothetical protein Slati_4156100 [Sesamum latifolium]|uniref:Transposase MuDR plant domain-containing protein n=1 Tax=Sesamum latifolium TaxID=2727402 RepID=A0AAW2T9T4_9LAMI
MRKLKKIFKQKSKKQMIATFQCENSGPSQEVEWYSDPGEEDELHSLDGSGSEKEIETPKHPYFKEDSNMKIMQLTIGLKFKSAQQFRETLRDYCVRNGFDLHYIRNENARITAKCKNDTCNWRIHASPIQVEMATGRQRKGANTVMSSSRSPRAFPPDMEAANGGDLRSRKQSNSSSTWRWRGGRGGGEKPLLEQYLPP